MTRQQQSSAPTTRFDGAAAAVLALACLVVYHGALDVGFVLDDWPDIVENRADQWPELGVEPVLRSLAAGDDRRPVAHLSFGLNHALGGLDPRGYHAFNVLVHLVNGWLVYAFACALFRRERTLEGQIGRPLPAGALRPAALFAALLFVVHPLQIQSVTYVVQRMNSMAAGFYLAALLCWLRGREATGTRRRWVWWMAAAGCGALSLGSKEIGFTLPLAIALVEWFFVDDLTRGWLRRRAPLLGAFALASLAVGVLALSSSGWERFDFTPGERLLTQARVVVLYLSLIALPLPSRLNLLHEIETSTSLIDPISTLLCGVLLGALLIFAITGARRRRLASFAVLWLFLGLAIESSVVPLRMIFEHRVYLPLVGVAILTAHALFARAGPRTRAGLASLLVALLAVGTVVRNEVWKEPLHLWTDTVTKSPGDPLAHARLGALLAGAGRLADARTTLERAIELDPGTASAHNALGTVWRGLGDLEAALDAHRTALRLAPGDASARMNAADVLLTLGRTDEAAAILEEAAASSADERLLLGLARVRERQGRIDEALALHRRIAELAPGYTAARLDEGRLLARRGDYAAAVRSFEAGLASAEPGSAPPGSSAAERAATIQLKIANAYWGSGRSDLAIAALEAAQRLAPSSPVAPLHLAWMLSTGPDDGTRDPDRAVSIARALFAGGGDTQAEVLDVLAAAQAAAGRSSQAEELAGRAAKIARGAGDEAFARRIDARRERYAEGGRLSGSPPPPGRLAPW